VFAQGSVEPATLAHEILIDGLQRLLDVVRIGHHAQQPVALFGRAAPLRRALFQGERSTVMVMNGTTGTVVIRLSRRVAFGLTGHKRARGAGAAIEAPVEDET
jgi:hypothetical protein